MKKGTIEIEIDYMKEIMTAYTNALDHGVNGSSSKTKDWNDGLKWRSRDALIEYVYLIENDHYSCKAKKLLSLLSSSPEHVKPHIYYYMCQCAIHASYKCLDHEFKLRAYLIKECYFYLEECKRLVNIEMSLYRNRESVFYLLSEQKLDDLFENLLLQESSLAESQNMQEYIVSGFDETPINHKINIGPLWNLIDFYKLKI